MIKWGTNDFFTELFHLKYVDTPPNRRWNLIRSPYFHPHESRLDIVTCFQRIQYEKEKTTNSTVEKPGKYYLGQVMKVNIISNAMWMSCSPYNVTRRALLCDSLSKN